jgi:hypothetical protein
MLSDVIVARFHALFEKYGLKRANFVVEPGRIEDHERGGIVEVVTATYTPTGKFHLYRIRPDSNWTYFVETDLQRGAFF